MQVLGQEKVADVNNRANQILEQQKISADLSYKWTTAGIMMAELKHKIRTTDNEAEKAKLEAALSRAKFTSEIMKNAKDIADTQGKGPAKQYLATVAGEHIDLLSQSMQDGLGKYGGMLDKSGEEQNKAVNADYIAADYQQQYGTPPPSRASQVNAVNNPNAISDISQGMQGAPSTVTDIQTAQVAPVQPQQGAGGAVNAAPLTAINQGAPQSTGHWERDRIGESGMMTRKWVANDAGQNEIDLAVRKQAALDQVAMEKDIAPIRTHVNKYLQTFDAAVEEIGGLESNALAALAKGKFNEAAAQVGEKPNVFALGQMVKSVGLALGSFLNRGRPTEPDAIAAEKMLTRLTYTKGVNIILRDYLNEVVKNGDREKAADLYWYLAYKGGSTTADAKMYGKNAINPLAEKPFTIRVKKGQ